MEVAWVKRLGQVDSHVASTRTERKLTSGSRSQDDLASVAIAIVTAMIEKWKDLVLNVTQETFNVWCAKAAIILITGDWCLLVPFMLTL